MKIPPLPFTVTDWAAVAPTVHPGETGFKLLPGMSYQVSNKGDAPHLSSTRTGAKLFIVD
jgi:hypothetical protein